MSQQGNFGPSMSGASELERQVVDLEVLVATTRSEMETSRPSQGVGVNAENTTFPIVPVGEPHEMSPRERPTELQRARISLVVRLRGSVVEL